MGPTTEPIISSMVVNDRFIADLCARSPALAGPNPAARKYVIASADDLALCAGLRAMNALGCVFEGTASADSYAMIATEIVWQIERRIERSIATSFEDLAITLRNGLDRETERYADQEI